MGYRTKLNTQYKVVGEKVYAYDNYSAPTGNDPHSRGLSAGSGVFLLTGKIITVTKQIKRFEQGRTTKPGVYAAFEIVKATTEEREGEYYVWVVYEGVDKVDEYTPPGEPKKKPEEFNIQVPIGRSLVLDLLSEKKAPPVDYPNNNTVVLLVDERQNVLKLDKKVVLVNATNEEFVVDINQGVGGIDVAAGDYNAIIDNESAVFTPSASTQTELEVSNPKYLRPGWVYQIRSGLNGALPSILNNSIYAHHWIKGADTNSDFHYGVFSAAADLPVNSTAAMFEGKFKESDFFRMEQILFSTNQVNQTGRTPPFLAAKIRTPNQKKENCFSWITYDDGAGGASLLKADIVKTSVTLTGQKSVIKIETVDTSVGYAAAKAITPVETLPLVDSAVWEIPAEADNDLQEVYRINGGANETMLGVSWKKTGKSPSVIVTLNQELSQEMPIVLKFWQTGVLTDFAAVGAEKDTTIPHNVSIKPENRNSDTASFSYSVEISRDAFYEAVSSLFDTVVQGEKKLNHRKIGITVDASVSNTQADVTGNSFAYPVLQNALFYLPGIYGSRLAIQYPKSGGEVLECWPSLGENFELLACQDDGVANYMIETDETNLHVLENIDFINRPLSQAHLRVAELLADANEFPEIYYKTKTGDVKLDHVVYKEIAYDWRLPLNEFDASKIAEGLNDAERKFPFIPHIAYNIKEEFDKILHAKPFVSQKFHLAGFDLGGIVVQGLLSISKYVQRSSEAAYYINVPFWGAPAFEYIMMTGTDPDVAFFTNHEPLRQTAPNMFAYYLLSPKERYSDASGTGWSVAERAARFDDAIANGLYNIVPNDLKGWPKSVKRKALGFNTDLANLAAEYDQYLQSNYPPVDSYVFHSAGRDTVTNPVSPYKAREQFKPIYNFDRLESEEISAYLNNTVISNLLKDKYAFNQQTYVHAYQKDSKWFIYDATFLKDIYTHIEMVNNNASLYAVNNSLELDKQLQNNGDGSVPSLSQLGLWYQISEPNAVKVALPTNENPIHLDGVNVSRIWNGIFKNIRKEPLDTMQPLPLENMKTGSLNQVPHVPQSEYVQIGLAGNTTGSLSLSIFDENGEPAPVGTKVTIANDAGEIAVFTLDIAGVLNLIAIPTGSINVLKVDLASNMVTRANDNTYLRPYTEDNSAQTVYPNMIIDYQWGPSMQLNYNPTYSGLNFDDDDPRFLLVRGGEWSLGSAGWVILGFENGFFSGEDQCINMIEKYAGEWVYLWVAGSKLNADYPVQYNRLADIDDNDYAAEINAIPINKGTKGRYQSTGADIEYRPSWLTDTAWKYVGAVKGQDGVQNNGPHLGFVPEGKYFYILALSEIDMGALNSINDGADVSSICVQDAILETTPSQNYHFILIDDTLSIDSDTEKTKSYNALKTILNKAINFPGENHITIRYLREPLTSETASTKTVSVQFNFSKPDSTAPGGKIDYQLSELIIKKVVSNNYKEPHLFISGTDMGLITSDAILTMFAWSFQGTRTPLLDALNDVKNDINVIKNNAENITVSIVSDGLPDPNGNRGVDANALVGTTIQTEVEAEIQGAIKTVFTDILALTGGIQLKLISSYPVSKATLDKLPADKSYVDNDWLGKAYCQLTDANNKKLINYDYIEKITSPLNIDDFQIDHKLVPHVDCTKTIKQDTGIWYEDNTHRIAPGERKRFTYDPNSATPPLARVSMPLFHNPATPVTEDDTAYASDSIHHQRNPYT